MAYKYEGQTKALRGLNGPGYYCLGGVVSAQGVNCNGQLHGIVRLLPLAAFLCPLFDGNRH
jgi:hypothetical protein